MPSPDLMAGQLELMRDWSPHSQLVVQTVYRYDVDGDPRVLTWEKVVCSCGREIGHA
jgi:hypothetical protein